MKKIKSFCNNKLCMFFVYSCAITIACSLNGMIDEEARESIAQRFGNKTANLEVLKKVVTRLNERPINNIRYAVPEIFGISHEEIVAFLQSDPLIIEINENQQTLRKSYATMYDCIVEQWHTFKTNQPIDASELTIAAKENLANIRRVIHYAFTTKLLTLGATRQQVLISFLKRAIADDRLLMVRSTGHEDSKKWANAGGNETVSSVQGDIKQISLAIGRVVESYFGERSFNQRMLAEDKSLIYADPFMPVLLQAMVGERPGKNDVIPVSGVAFSQEAEGYTPHVVAINATWGHGEGVVNGLVPTDQFYVGPTGVIHSLISIKNERIFTNDNYELTTTGNKAFLQKIPCLINSEIRAISHAARFVEEYYAHPQDVEFVFQGTTLYLVQTRPIVRLAVEPSYIKQEYLKIIQPADIKEVFFIGSGGGATRVIENESQIIIADTISKALDEFLHTSDKGNIKAILVGTMAPPTSHEASNFRGAGKPVIYLPDTSTVKSWLREQHIVLIDAQRALLTKFVPQKAVSTVSDVLVHNAWVAHPISKKMSVVRDFNSDITERPLFKALMSQLRSSPIEIAASPAKHLELLRTAQAPDKIGEILQSLLHRISKRIDFEKNKQKVLIAESRQTNPSIVSNLKYIFRQLQLSAYEILITSRQWFKQEHTPQERIIWLYPLVFLEALIKQIPNSREFIEDYSLGSLIKIEQQEANIVEKLQFKGQQYRRFDTQMAKAVEDTLTDSLGKHWENFVQHLSLLPSNLHEKCISTAKHIKELDLMPLWLNISFARAVKESGKTQYQAIAQRITDEFEQSATLLQWAHDIQEKIAAFAKAKIEDQGQFKLWQIFKNDVIVPMTDKNILEHYDELSELSKFAWLVTAQKFVEVFDGAIKKLERSPLYANKRLRAENFYTMIQDYLSVLESWAEIPSIVAPLNAMVDQHTFTTMQEYLAHIKQLLMILKNLKHEERQMNFSDCFNVSASALGSQAAWSRSICQNDYDTYRIVQLTSTNTLITLEDLFSLIHQNLIVIMNRLLQQTGISGMDIPELTHTNRSNIETLSISVRQKPVHPSLIGITFGKTDITFWYNLPLLNHSSTMQVSYDRKTRRNTISVQFLGQPGVAAGNRWAEVVEWAHLLTYLTPIQCAKQPELDSKRGIVSVTFDIKTDIQSRIVANYIAFLEQLMTDDFNSVYPNKSVIDVIADVIQLENKKIGKVIFDAVPNHPEFITLWGYLSASALDSLENEFARALKFVMISQLTPLQKRLLDSIELKMRYNWKIPILALFDALYSYLLSHPLDKVIVKKIAGMIRSSIIYGNYWNESTAIKLEDIARGLVSLQSKSPLLKGVILDVLWALVYRNRSAVSQLAYDAMLSSIHDSDESIRRKAVVVLGVLVSQNLIDNALAFELIRSLAGDSSADIRKKLPEILEKLSIQVFDKLKLFEQLMQDPETELTTLHYLTDLVAAHAISQEYYDKFVEYACEKIIACKKVYEPLCNRSLSLLKNVIQNQHQCIVNHRDRELLKKAIFTIIPLLDDASETRFDDTATIVQILSSQEDYQEIALQIFDELQSTMRGSNSGLILYFTFLQGLVNYDRDLREHAVEAAFSKINETISFEQAPESAKKAFALLVHLATLGQQIPGIALLMAKEINQYHFGFKERDLLFKILLGELQKGAQLNNNDYDGLLESCAIQLYDSPLHHEVLQLIRFILAARAVDLSTSNAQVRFIMALQNLKRNEGQLDAENAANFRAILEILASEPLYKNIYDEIMKQD